MICNVGPDYDFTNFFALDFHAKPWSDSIGAGDMEEAQEECAQHCRENPDCKFFHINYIGPHTVGSEFIGKFDGRLEEAWRALGRQSHTCFLHSECDDPFVYSYTYSLFQRKCSG